MSSKPYSEACVRNGPSILDILKRLLPEKGQVLEIGSGTGQHAVMFAAALPLIRWQTSDMPGAHAGMRLWIDEKALPNLYPPLQLDVRQASDWPPHRFDAVFTANTLHIMAPESVAALFASIASVLKPSAQFLCYGPFMYAGQHSSQSNHEFDEWLRKRDGYCAIRDVDWLRDLGKASGLSLQDDIAMPANNRMLVWTRSDAGKA